MLAWALHASGSLGMLGMLGMLEPDYMPGHCGGGAIGALLCKPMVRKSHWTNAWRVLYIKSL